MNSSQKEQVLELQPKDTKLNPRQLRSQGDIPVTIYGKSLPESVSAQVNARHFAQVRNSRFVQVIKAKLPNSSEDHLLLIKSIERNPVTDQILNVQFQRLLPAEQATLVVPIVYTGSSPLVQAGGTLFINKKSVEISCVASQIPSHVEFGLEFFAEERRIAVYRNLKLPAGCELKSQAIQIIAKVSMPQVSA